MKSTMRRGKVWEEEEHEEYYEKGESMGRGGI
jgi:hypothetical protein